VAEWLLASYLDLIRIVQGQGASAPSVQAQPPKVSLWGKRTYPPTPFPGSRYPSRQIYLMRRHNTCIASPLE
jgi:hypothetical protein